MYFWLKHKWKKNLSASRLRPPLDGSTLRPVSVPPWTDWLFPGEIRIILRIYQSLIHPYSVSCTYFLGCRLPPVTCSYSSQCIFFVVLFLFLFLLLFLIFFFLILAVTGRSRPSGAHKRATWGVCEDCTFLEPDSFFARRRQKDEEIKKNVE